MRYREGWDVEWWQYGGCPLCGDTVQLGAWRRSDGVSLWWKAACQRHTCAFELATNKKRQLFAMMLAVRRSQ